MYNFNYVQATVLVVGGTLASMFTECQVQENYADSRRKEDSSPSWTLDESSDGNNMSANKLICNDI